MSLNLVTGSVEGRRGKLRAAEEEQTKLNAKLSEAKKSLEVSIGIVIIKCTSMCHLVPCTMYMLQLVPCTMYM